MTGRYHADLVAPTPSTRPANPDPFVRAVAALLEDGVPTRDAQRTVNAIRNRHEDAYPDALARHCHGSKRLPVLHALTAAHHAAQAGTP